MTSSEALPVSTNFSLGKNKFGLGPPGQNGVRADAPRPSSDPPTPPKARPTSCAYKVFRHLFFYALVYNHSCDLAGAARSSSIGKRFFRIGKAVSPTVESLPPVVSASKPIPSSAAVPEKRASSHSPTKPLSPYSLPPVSALPPLPSYVRPERTAPPEEWTAPDFAGRSVAVPSPRRLPRVHPHSPPISTHSHSQNGSTGSLNPSLSPIRAISRDGGRSSRHTTSSSSSITSQDRKGVKPGEIFDWEGMSRSYRESTGASLSGLPEVPAKRAPQAGGIGANADAEVLKKLPSRRESLMAMNGSKLIPQQSPTSIGAMTTSGKLVSGEITDANKY